MSPDGRSVYVAGHGGDSISHLFRDPATGQLALDGCLNNDGSQSCGDLPNAPFNGAAGVAVSPDGRSVYVTAYAGNAVLHFFREPAGQLFYDGCLANDDTQGCVDLPGEPFDGAAGVAVSPDGASVYVAAGNAVAQFAVNGPAGQIAYRGCLNEDGSSSCVEVPGEPLDGVTDVAVSPDGRRVYVTAFGSDAVGYLLRNPGSELDWDGCLNNDGSDGCENVTGAPLDAPLGITVSPDGRSVYVASAVSDSISHLAPDATGKPLWVGCVNNDGSSSCADLPGEPIDYAADVAVSPDGRSVYAAAYESDAVVHLVRDTAGRLSWDSCLNDDGSQGCGDLLSAPLNGPQHLTASPDGRSLYVGTILSGTLARFTREQPAPPAGPPSPPPPPATDRAAPTISRLALRHRRFRFVLSEPATVRITIERRRKPGRGRRTLTRPGRAGLNRLRVTLRRGAYRARFTAVDAAGNRSRTATLKFRVAARGRAVAATDSWSTG